MDLQAILERVKKLKDQLAGTVISPVPDTKEPTFFNAQAAQQYHQGSGSLPQGKVLAAQAPTPTPSPTLFKKPTQANMGYIRPEHEKFLESTVFPLTDAEKFPRELVAGQWAGEGGRKMQNDLNNLFGIGPNMKFKDLPSNIKTYMSTVKKLLKQRGIEDLEGLTGDDILTLIQDERGQRYEGHNPDPKEYTRFIPSVPEYRYYKNKKK